MTELKRCTGCGQDKPNEQFEVTETNQDGSTWTRRRKWCLSCCNALFERQQASAARGAAAVKHIADSEEARRQALGSLPEWCDRTALDYLVSGPSLYSQPVVSGASNAETRAKCVAYLWQNFQAHEREAGEPLGARGSRFLIALSGLLHEPEAKLRARLKRMVKHDSNIARMFETESSKPPPKLQMVGKRH